MTTPATDRKTSPARNGNPASARTRRALLEAAEELFSAHGYEAVGIRDIASRAETNVASIKYHFGSKRELYLATIRWLLEHGELRESWSAFDPLPTTRRGAATLLVRYIRGVFEQTVSGGRQERCVRLMLQEALRPGEDFEFITTHFSAPYERLMVELVQTLVPGRSELFYVTSGRSIFAQVLHNFVWKPFLERSEYGSVGATIPTLEAADEVATFVLRGLGCSKVLIEKARTAVFSPPETRGRPD